MYAARGGFHKINCRFGIYHAKSVSLQAGGWADMQPCSGPIRFFIITAPHTSKTMFKTPPITKNLIIINVIMFLAAMVLRNYGIDLDSALGLHFFKADDFALYQLVTYMFMHGGWSHIFFNMFALWMFGRTMESVWGPRKFFAFYMLCGIGAGLTQEIWQLGEYYVEGLANYEYVNTGAAMIPMGDYLNMWTTIGASGACYAVLLAFGMTFPNETLIIFPIPIPLKAKYFVVVVAAIELFSSFATNGNVAHFAHLGGMVFGYFIIRHWRRQGARRSGFTGWENYNPPRDGFFKRMRNKFNEAMQNRNERPNDAHLRGYDNRRDDYEYNERKNEKQQEIDRILEKIKKSGYESLTNEEKRKLFDASNR